MPMSRAESEYLERRVMSSSRERLVPLLYEHLVANLRRAKLQIEAGDLEGKAASIGKASSILLELRGTLDFEKGGEIAERLSALYSYFAAELLTIGRSLDVVMLDRITTMAASLHEAWERAATSVAQKRVTVETRAVTASPDLRV
jgi:flagellar protein FliS